jgi:hypothetical protein
MAKGSRVWIVKEVSVEKGLFPKLTNGCLYGCHSKAKLLYALKQSSLLKSRYELVDIHFPDLKKWRSNIFLYEWSGDFDHQGV